MRQRVWSLLLAQAARRTDPSERDGRVQTFKTFNVGWQWRTKGEAVAPGAADEEGRKTASSKTFNDHKRELQ